MIISIVGILLTIFFVIGTHEAAHFLTARALGVRVLRFSIGFGKTLWRKIDRSQTEYVIALIPLGGYVQMLDENEGEVPAHELHRAYNRQPYYKKMLIVLAGPAMNIFCALVLYWIIFMIGFPSIKPLIGEVKPQSIAAQSGLHVNQEIMAVDGHKIHAWPGFIIRLLAHAGNKDSMTVTAKSKSGTEKIHTLDLSDWQLDGLTPDPLGSIGLMPYAPPIPLVIGQVEPDSPAARAGLLKQDVLVAVNGKPIKNWETLLTLITDHPNQTVQLEIKRAGKKMTLPVPIGYKRHYIFIKGGYLGIGPVFSWPKEMITQIQYSPLTALKYAGQQLYELTYFNLLLMGKLITGKLSFQSLGGPITIFDSASAALNIGLIAFLGFLAFLSISIGVVNLLPIPGLDGGHLLIQTIECVLGRKIPDRILVMLFRLGFSVLLILLTVSLINDLMRLT